MFSIIIPLYNKAAYIQKAIQSVMAQTYQEFEVIVVDDGSTDRSLENLQFTIHDLQLSDEKIKIVEQKNQGVSTARNNGVKLAKYDYIAFLDADDWWEPTYLEEMKGLIEQFPEAGIYSSSYFKVKKQENIPARIGVDSDFTKGYYDYLKAYSRSLYQPIWTGAAIVKKSVFFSNNGFKPILKLGEDFDLWLRITFENKVALLNKPLAYYNQDVDSTNRAIGVKLYEPEQHMLFSDYGELNNNSEFRHLFEVLALYGLLPYYLSGKNKKEVNEILARINWKNHSFKYKLYYKILPKKFVQIWFAALTYASQFKSYLKLKL